MRTAPKIAISLLISIIIFSGLAVAAYAGLFNILETRFYQPTVIKSMEGHLASVSDAMEAWHGANKDKFKAFVEADAVKRSLLPNQSSQDIFDRANLAGSLMADMPGLVGIRIIDAGDTTQNAAEDTGKRRIHFSTFQEDILKKEQFQISYDSYGKNAEDIPFKFIARADADNPRVITEAAKDRFLYCFPFRDAYSTWRGTAVFYVSARSAAQNLVAKNLFRISDDIALLGSADYSVTGAVSGMPQAGREILGSAVLGRWERQDFTTDRIVSTDKSGWVLLSHKTGDYGFTGELVQESLFAFPQAVRIFFLVLSFLTTFLIVFLLLNLKQDNMVVIRNRVRRFQVQLLGELMEKTDDARWEEIRKNLAYRKHDINAELKKGFGRRFNKKHGAEVDELLDKSWEEILTAIGHQETKQATLTNAEEIKRMLEQVLQNNAINLNLTGVNVSAAPSASANAAPKTGTKPKPSATPIAAAAAEAEEVEELGEVEELDEVEELEDVEEIEEVGEAEELEEAEAVAEVEEADEIEEIEEIGEAEELEEAEAVEEAESVDELGEAEEIEEAEAAEEAEAIEEAREPAIEAADETAEDEEIENEAAEAESAEEPELEIEIEVEAEELPEITVYSFDELKTLDDYVELDTDELFEDEAVKPAEPDEVDYLDGEWEPDLLDVATDDELAEFIEEELPDEILVYDFKESPQFDTDTRWDSEGIFEPIEDVPAQSPDFSSLDAIGADGIEDATEVDYIDLFLLNHELCLHADLRDEPISDYLEVIGDAEPEELIDLAEAEGETGDEAIVSHDGLFSIAAKDEKIDAERHDPEFQKLVDSVLL